MKNANYPENIVLIGMPGSGKSTLGRLLADRLDKTFRDSDLLLEKTLGCSLQLAIDQWGYQFLRAKEAELLSDLKLSDTVLATGGSAVYSDDGMRRLASQATLIYLNCSIDEIMQRVANFETRGLARPSGQSMEALYGERAPLYEHYADAVVACNDCSQENALARILDSIRSQES